MTDPLAAWLDSYRTSLRAALQIAASQGYRRVHGNAAAGELHPPELSGSGRRHLRKILQDHGLQLEALALEFPGRGLADPARADERLDQFRRTLDLCRDLNVPQVTVAVGGLAAPQSAPLAREVLNEAARLASQFDTTAAVLLPHADLQPGLATLAALDCPYLRLALDSALLAGQPGLPVPAEQLASVYLRDARRTRAGVEEVPFGSGEVDFRGLIRTLADAGDRTGLVVRRDGPDGVDALRRGREYIRSLSP